MLPVNEGKSRPSNDITSPETVAQICTIYKHIIGGNPKASAKISRELSGGLGDGTVQKIV